ncbi:MAG: ABC transporter ATP-binding protein [Candidatus Delongbacteria bacterium]|nr:ABC transporter ATP-binding protein [Candidatus Delongbacteria bacterium]
MKKTKEYNKYDISYKQLLKRMPKLYQFMKKYKWIILGLGSFDVLSQFLIILPPIIIQYSIDEVIPFKDIYSINILFGMIVFMYLTRSGLFLGHIYIRWYLQYHIRKDIREKLFNSLLVQTPTFFSKRVSGEITSRMNNDVGSVSYLASDAFFDLLNTFLQIFFSLATLFYLSWKITLAILVLVGFQYILVSIVMSYFKRYRKRVSEKWGKILGYLQEVLSNVKIVMAFGNENYEAARHTSKSRDYIKDNIKLGVTNRMFEVVATIFWHAFYLVIIIYGLRLISSGEITMGILLAFIILVKNFFEPIFGLSGTIIYVIGAFVSIDRIYEYIESPSELATVEDPKKLTDPKGKLSFENIKFRYEKGKELIALNDVSFEIEDGKSIALVGHSGAGKSTIVNLILRFYDPENGSIKFNGVDLKELDLDSYRENISIVFQDALLFNDTILNNLKYSKLDATLEEVDKACHDANIYDFIKDLPEGYETVVGERGLKLSGGQRQRLSIARALLKNPKILILDEATASIDSISENIIQAAIDKIMKDRTTVIIAHRLTTIANVDKILVFDDGKIVEWGHHSELLEKKGIYHELWTTQMKDREMTGMMMNESNGNK